MEQQVIWSLNYSTKFPCAKKRQVIFPNRWDQEKRPQDFLEIARRVKELDPTIEFVVTTSRPTFRSTSPQLEHLAKHAVEDGIITVYSGLPKTMYYEIMAQSRVMLSTSIEENWGYCVTEAATFGTVPICTRGYSYQELLPDEFLFSSIEEAVVLVMKAVDTKIPHSKLAKIVDYADGTLDRIIKLIKEFEQ